MGFEKCHPAVNLLFFAAVITAALCLRHPLYLALSLACAFAYAVKRTGGKAVLFTAFLLPAAAAFAVYYSRFHHFGMTVLRRNFIGNGMTLEAFVFGLVLGVCAAAALLWLACVFSVFTADKTVYLFGRIAPRLALFAAILLRLCPRIGRQAQKLHTAQKGIGRGIGQGDPLQRARNCLRIFSMLVTWTIESLSLAAASMRSRGSALRGRTAFSVYRFDSRDRAYVLLLSACATLTLMGALSGAAEAFYDPVIRIASPAVQSLPFYTGYAALCLQPLALELWTEYRFNRARAAL